MAFSQSIWYTYVLVFTYVATDNTTDYIHKLEQKISDLETHTLASEQKQAAVLASILSKLQSQEVKIQENADDLQNLTASSNLTTPTTESQHVAFEARTASDKKSTLIKFNAVPVNVGGGYDADSGMFTAPTTGIYHFWFTVYVSENHVEHASQNPTIQDVVKLITGDVTVGPSYEGYVGRAVQPGKHKYDIRAVQGLHVVPLTAGDTVYVQLLSSGIVKAGSSFGGMFIG